jgi:DNA replication protein DnaC
MLVERGYDAEYLNLRYHCNKCKDTGFIGPVKCSCYKQKLVKLYYKNSELENTVALNNFDNFDLNLFSNHKLGDEKFTPRKNMENILQFVLREYLPEFSKTSTNMLFYGNPGSGKTYLSYCIAKAILDLGYLVVYKTSDELIKNLREIRFNNDSSLESLILECDLLIIDDLGAEHLNEFSITELFNVINKRILTNKKMLISTNLTLPGITKQYSERIASRLIGEFKLCKFYSEDIRIKKNLEKNK